jgi:hypothetical protein
VADETTTPEELVTPEAPTSPTQLPLALLTFLIGIVVGVAAVLLIILANSGTNSPLVVPSSKPGNITAEVDATLIDPIAEQSLQQAGIPGKISNIQVTFAEGAEMTITGQYQYSVLNIPVTQHFTIVLQPAAGACKLQLHIIKANYGGIPATSFATIFEKTINQRLQDAIPSTIENGKYSICMVGVHTHPNSVTINFVVTPRPA